MFGSKKTTVVTAEEALPGRTDQTMPVPGAHFVNGHPLTGPWPAGYETAVFGMGCFWGAERKFWKVPGVVSTQVGYTAGHTPNPTYKEVCSGQTGHNEVVRVVYDPTQGMRQGNDAGTQYRSGIYVADAADKATAESSKRAYAAKLVEAGFGKITTEVLEAPPFYYAEDYHQQYLEKNPEGYCGLGGCGVGLPV